jgi:integrase
VSRSVVVKRLKEDAGRIVYLTPEQCQTILKIARNANNTQVYPFILIGLETGMRYTEILSIQLENIDLPRREIYLPRTKSGDRTQAITEHLAVYLAEYLKTIPSAQPWLFPCIGNRKSKAGHTVSIEEAYRDVIKKAGLDPYEIVRHTLRHTAITHLVQAGVDLPTVMDISGHKTLKMVQRYSHRDSDHIRAAMDKLESRLRPVKAQLEAVK